MAHYDPSINGSDMIGDDTPIEQLQREWSLPPLKLNAQDELVDLVHRYEATARIVAEHDAIISNPQCGKPGKGFKAARKLRPVAETWRMRLTDRRNAINLWITRNNKASKDERAKRLARVMLLLADWGTTD